MGNSGYYCRGSTPGGTTVGVALVVPEECLTNFTTVKPGPGPILNNGVRLQLETDFDIVRDEYLTKKGIFEQIIANGDRQELHDAVANLTPANKVQVKNLLLSESPYLSESLLIELADQAPGYFPNIWLKNVILANIEVTRSNDFMNYLLIKQNPIPQGIYNQIVAQLDTYTERTVRQHEVVGLNSQKNRIANYILKDITQDTSGINWADFNLWSTKRGDILCEFQISDNFLDKQLKDSCLNHLLKVDDQISQLMAGVLKTELINYRAFKTAMLTLTNSDGILEGLNDVSEPVVRYYAENAIGMAQVQAQNLLCFFRGECADAPPIPVQNGFNMGMMLSSVEDEAKLEDSHLFEVHPNPNNGQFKVILGDLGIGIIQLMDMNGRVIYSKTTTGSEVLIDVVNSEAGFYIIQFVQDNVVLESQKLIKK